MAETLTFNIFFLFRLLWLVWLWYSGSAHQFCIEDSLGFLESSFIIVYDANNIGLLYLDKLETCGSCWNSNDVQKDTLLIPTGRGPLWTPGRYQVEKLAGDLVWMTWRCPSALGRRRSQRLLVPEHSPAWYHWELDGEWFWTDDFRMTTSSFANLAITWVFIEIGQFPRIFPFLRYTWGA